MQIHALSLEHLSSLAFKINSINENEEAHVIIYSFNI